MKKNTEMRKEEKRNIRNIGVITRTETEIEIERRIKSRKDQDCRAGYSQDCSTSFI
jgi:hypothetical protein